MIVLLIVSLIALLLTYLETIGKLRDGMMWGFVLVTIIAAIHYDYGNDYMSYMQMYKDITYFDFNLSSVLAGDVWKEPGWALLNYAFIPFGGFFGLVAALSVLQNVIYYKAIKKYVDKEWWTMAVFIYLFSSSLYVLNMSMMRQGLAISLFVWAFSYFKDRRIIPSLLILIAAASVHNSAKILLPFVLWGFIPMGKRFSKYMSYFYAVMFVVLYMNADFVNTIFMAFMDIEDMAKYAESYGKGVSNITMGLGFALQLIPFIISLLYLLINYDSYFWKCRLICIACIGFFIMPFALIIPLIDRVGMYFTAYSIFAIPITYEWITRKELRYSFLAIFIFMTLYNYYLFFNSDVYSDAFSNYKTIFSAF